MELYGSLLNISGSVSASTFTGSFIGDGSGLTGIQASGVTGLNLSQISNGDATASISSTGFNVNKNTQIQGNLSVTGALIANEYIVSSSVIYMTTSFASGSSAFGNDNNDIHQFTGSVQITGSISLNGQAIGTGKLDETTFQSYTSSNNSRVSALETSSGSLNSFTSSINTTIKSKLDSDNVISGSVQVNITGTTGYSTFSSSISNSINNLSSSVATTTSGLTNTISSLSSSVATTTNGLTSTITSLSSSVATTTIGLTSTITSLSSSVATTTSGITSTITSLSSSLTSSIGELSSAVTSLSSSLTSSIGSLSSSIATTNLNQDNKLTALETSSGSLNSFTSSINTTIKSKLNNDGVISGSSQILNGSNLVSSSAQVTAYGFATTGSNLFKGTQTHSGSILPSVDNAYDLGSIEYQWRDVYISSGSLYIDGTKVLSSTTQELTITTDNGQSLKILESTTDSIVLQTADGDIELKSSADGDILLDPTNGKIMLKGPVEVLSGQKIQSSVGGTPVVFANDIVVSGSIDLTGTIDGIDLQSLSSSLNTRIGGIETATGSLNSYTSSNTTNINAIHTATSSLNTFTSSINTTIKSKLNADGVISGSAQVILTGTTGYSTFSSSVSTSIGEISGSIATTTAGLGSTIGSLSSSVATTTSGLSSTITSLSSSVSSSIGSLSSSVATTTSGLSSTITSLSSSVATTTSGLSSTITSLSSSVATYNLGQDNRLTSIEGKTGSYATTGSNIFHGNQTITGSLYVSQDLIIAGSSSIQHISSSVVNIADNIITVNAQNPSIRFGGLAVIDSGSSPQVSGSMLFDSTNDQWIFVHQNQATVTSSVLLMGPQTFNNLGNETFPTNNRLLKSVNAEHLGDSNISDNGITVTILSNTIINGTISATGTTLVSGSSQISHDSTTGYIANRHIDHTAVSITAGNGLSGGGDISSTRTVTLDTGSVHFLDGVKKELNTEGVISGSSQILNGSGVWSGSAQLPSGVVSGSSQVLAGTTIHSGSFFAGVSVVSGSGQISFGGITGVPAGLVSGSSQVLAGTTIHSGSFFNGISVVSGSAQISFNGITDKPTLVSGSSQITFGSISSIPGGLVSGSSQIDLTATTNYSTGIKTRLNAEGVISGSSQVTGIGNAQLTNSSFNIGTTSISLGRASASQTLTGVNIDGNAQFLANNDAGTTDANSLWRAGIYSFFNGTNVPGGDFGMISIPTWKSTDTNSRYNLQIGANIQGNLLYRTTNINGVGTFRTVLDSANYTSYSPTLTGSGASGSWGIDITGNSATVTNGVYTTGNQTIGGVKTFSSELRLGSSIALRDNAGEWMFGKNSTTIQIGSTAITNGISFESSANSTFTYRGNNIYHAGNLTNLNQLTNGPGYLTGNQNITLSGDVTGSGATSIVTTIASNAITTGKINNGAVTAAKLATFGASEGISWAANTDGASITFDSTGDGGSGSRALSNLLITLTDNGDEGLRVIANTSELFFVNTNQIQYKGNNIYHAGNLTNLNQLTNGPGYITSYTETDTLATVTSRGNSTTGRINVRGAGNQSGGNILIGNTGNGTAKWSYLTGTHFNADTQTQGFALIGGLSTATQNAVVIGGNIYETNPSTEIQFWTHNATTHNLGGSQRGVINSSGNWGIGNLDPQTRLHVGGNITVSSATDAGRINFGTDGDGIALYRDNAYDLVLQQNAASGNPVYIAGAGNVVISIDSNNNETDRAFIVGSNAIKSTNALFSVNESGNGSFSGTLTVSSTLNLPNNALLSINNEPDTWGARFRTTSSTTNLGGSLKNIIWCGGGTNEGFAVTGTGTGGASFEVRNDGRTWVRENLTVGGTLTENSAIKYKTNIESLQNSLDKVIKLRGVTYIKKDSGNKELGLIAEEVNEILPELVVKNDNGEVESVAYGRVVSVLIEAIKELKSEIDFLKGNK